LYSRREIYERVRGYDSFEPWLSRIRNCSTTVLDDAYKKIPPHWHDNEWDAIEALLEQLYRRRNLAPDLVRESKNASRDPFPNWALATSVGSVATRGQEGKG
jgi:hypothetical protein